MIWKLASHMTTNPSQSRLTWTVWCPCEVVSCCEHTPDRLPSDRTSSSRDPICSRRCTSSLPPYHAALKVKGIVAVIMRSEWIRVPNNHRAFCWGSTEVLHKATWSQTPHQSHLFPRTAAHTPWRCKAVEGGEKERTCLVSDLMSSLRCWAYWCTVESSQEKDNVLVRLQ